jgi:hypothetical protein
LVATLFLRFRAGLAIGFFESFRDDTDFCGRFDGRVWLTKAGGAEIMLHMRGAGSRVAGTAFMPEIFIPVSYHTDFPRLLLSLWDLLGADSVFLLLARGGCLSLFLRCLLARGFRRFVTHTER